MISLAVFLGGTFLSLEKLGGLAAITGSATTGTATITVQATAGIDVTNSINFGSGTTNSSGGRINITTNGTSNWNPTYSWNDCATTEADIATCGGLQIQNVGNVDVNVTFNITENESSFIGGTSPNMTWASTTANASGSYNGCGADASSGNISNVWQKVWANVSGNPTAGKTIYNNTVCTNLTFANQQDFVTFELNLTLPNDAGQGSRTATVTFTASQK